MEELEKKNRALKYLGSTLTDKKRFIFSKLGNELTLITTKLCNLNCSYCYDKANIQDKEALKCLDRELTSSETVNLISLCKELGVSSIRITGGEAILKKGFFDILKACDDMDVSLCSNGLVLKNFLEKIVKIHPKKLHIHLSLDGLEAHKKYRIGSDPIKVIDLARYIKKKFPQIRISINTVISPENIYEFVDTYNLLKDTKIDRWSISFPRLVENALEKGFRVPNIRDFISNSKDLIKAYEADKKPFGLTISYFYKHEAFDETNYKAPNTTDLSQHPCLPSANGARGLIVDSFGNIVDCLTIKPLLKHPINIKEFLSNKKCSINEFISLLFNSLDSEFYSLQLKNKKICLDCRYFNICKGGCPANAYYLFKEINHVDLMSCLLFYWFEKEFLLMLNDREKPIFKNLIRKDKNIKIIEKTIEEHLDLLTKLGCY
jgi:radical SAM protein with 4Fe4S-binding SPASM domain